MASSSNELDESLQSRQLAVYGRETMHRLRFGKVLVVGGNGLAAEIIKNVVLANVGEVTLCDLGETATMAHLSSHFFLTESDLGKPVAEATRRRFQELNDSVILSATSELPKSLEGFNVVVAVGVPLPLAIRLDEGCRACKSDVAFIRCCANGLYGSVFTDFGDDFIVRDVGGREPATAILKTVKTTRNYIEIGYVITESNHYVFREGDVVRFSEVKGMVELNGRDLNVAASSRLSFTVEKPRGMTFSPYITGGIATQIKQPETCHFKCLKEALDQPGDFVEVDFSCPGRAAMLHCYGRAMDEFALKHSSPPRPASPEDLDEVVRFTEDYAKKMETPPDVDGTLIRRLASRHSATINPMAAIMGGIVGQEVVKAASGKFRPIVQWLHMEATACLPEEDLPAELLQPSGDRYSDMVAVFGADFQQTLSKLKYFMVGCGALGCEFLKNFALMGVATAGEGCLTVTDDDLIERSNLTRQFLFRNHDVGKPKSSIAANAVAAMNPAIKIKAFKDRVAPTTEHVFGCDFWRSLDGVCTALDNVKARRYVDTRCIQYGVPFLDSGTLGTQCSVQVIIPHLSECYGAGQDSQKQDVAPCVMHHFPHSMEHIIPLARSEFEGHFETNPTEVMKYMTFDSGQEYVDRLKGAGINASIIMDKLRGNEAWGCSGIADCIGKERPRMFEDCIVWARLRFEDYFVNKIVQLTALFPETHETRPGMLFWSPPKRFPQPVRFDVNDPMCMLFIVAASNLRAKMFSVAPPQGSTDEAYFRQVLETVTVPVFIPRTDLNIDTDEDAKPGEQEVDEGATAEAEADLPSVLEKMPAPSDLRRDGFQVRAEEFEKDDDTNFHMDFITSLANLRARNYSIKEVDKLEAKLKAGNIIPAIATTTAMATGFVCLELLKLVNKKPVSHHKNLYANLSVPSFSQSQPLAPQQVISRKETVRPDPERFPDYEEVEDIVAYPEKHTVWDSLRVGNDHDFTLQELIDHFQTYHSLQVVSVAVDTTGKSIYNTVLPSTSARLPKMMMELLESVGQINKEGRREVVLIVGFERDGKSVDSPPVTYNLC